MAKRLYTGCGVRQDKEEALQWWEQVTKRRIPGLSSALNARSLACVAHVQWDVHADPDGTWNIDAVYRACALADGVVQLGLISPIVLVIAQATENAGFRRWEDLKCELPPNSSHGANPDKFAMFTSLWEAADRRKDELQQKEARREEKHTKRPKAYVCAADGCGLEATSKTALMRCAGPCKLEDKPSYCSKECQRRVSVVPYSLSTCADGVVAIS